MRQVTEVDIEQYSGLIGSIYDCALEPDQWPATIETICNFLGCMNGAIFLLDFGGSSKLFQYWGVSEDWARKFLDYADDTKAIYQGVPSLSSQSIDRPLVLSRDVPPEVHRELPIYRDWGRPMGLIDSIQSVVLRDKQRIGVISFSRHESIGVATDREISILRLLGPHLRRAVTIGDLMDLKKVKTLALSATLDNFVSGVVIVGANLSILHANASAMQMFNAGFALQSLRGKLSAINQDAQAELVRAIGLGCKTDAEIGSNGIGVALGTFDGEAAIAHVLPLGKGEIRTRIVPQATAAVFITRAGQAPPNDLDGISVSFKLTPAETRLLRELLSGASLSKAAHQLEIAETTAKTHLQGIFSKTGVSRQVDLIALVGRLVPSIRRPS